MKAWKKIIGGATIWLAAGVLCPPHPQPAHAQDTKNARFFVELKDATLYDSLEMLFKAGGNDPRSIDASAKSIVIGSFVRNNIDWYEAALQLSKDYDYRVYRDSARTVHVEPRTPTVTEGGAMGGLPGSRPAPGARPGGLPRNPFGSTTTRPLIQPTSYGDDATKTGAAEGQIIIRSNAQTNSAFGGKAGSTKKNPDAKFYIVPVKHVYVGGIASIFKGSVGIISTEQFVVPASASQGGMGGGGGFGGGSGGFGGGLGGGVSSFGGGGNRGFGGNNNNRNNNRGGIGTGGFGGGIGGFGNRRGNIGVLGGFGGY